jgi:hypothetical protein
MPVVFSCWMFLYLNLCIMSRYVLQQMKAALPQAALDRLLASGIAGVTQQKLDDVKVYTQYNIYTRQHWLQQCSFNLSHTDITVLILS